MPTVDVLIPTCDRPAALAVTLAGLCAQSLREPGGAPFRVVVSDQGDTPVEAAGEVRAVLAVLRAHGHDVELHRHLPRRGLAEQRQFLLERCRGELALFLDDDVLLEPWVLAQLTRALAREGCGFVGSAVLGLSHAGDVRPHEQQVELWAGPVAPELVEPGSAAWQRHRLHNAANLWHVQRALGVDPERSRVYKVAWVGGCVLYDVAKLRAVGGFGFWRELPREHCGEDVLAQLRVMACFGGCGIMPSGVYHLELPTTVPNREVDAPRVLPILNEGASKDIAERKCPTRQDGARPVCDPLSSAHSRPDWSRVRRLLVVRLDNLGDVVMTGPALRAVKDNLPDVHLTLLASPGGAPAAALLPWIDEVRVHRAPWQDLGRLPFDPARELAFIDELRRGAFDAALILTSFRQSPHPVAQACALAGIPARIGQSHERGRALTFALASAPDPQHQVERNLRLVEAVGLLAGDRRLAVRLPDGARDEARDRLAARGVAGEYLVLNPFASCPARTYDPARFAAAARLLSERSGLPVVICGADRDRARAEPLAAVLGDRGIDLVGETGLPVFAALIAGARLVLTNNTSSLHLADAFAVPQLVMYAGTELESQWAPRTSPHVLLQREAVCSPCYRFECPHGHVCLAFTPGEVAAAGERLLADTNDSRAR